MTYADAVTLLLTFLVLLLSVSTVDQAKYETFSEVISGELSNTEELGKFKNLQKNIETSIETKELQNLVGVEGTPTGIKVKFGSRDFFKIGKADLLPASKILLNDIIKSIREFSTQTTAYTVEVEGHTDDVPINTTQFPSNWELSAVRATNVVRYFIEVGLDKRHLKASGFGSLFPIVPNKDADGKGIKANRAQNRRIEIFISRETPVEVGGGITSKTDTVLSKKTL